MSSTTREIIVETQCGKLRGCVQRSYQGNDYYAFKGIPYAKPPVGPLRFRISDPEPVEPWSGVRDATQYGPRCLQIPFDKPGQFVGSEDCLYLNVFSRNIDSSRRQPVMVWIHGGAYLKLSGDDSHSGPDYYMNKDDFIFVTINYRLGILGFLNVDDEVAPGNQGSKDQVLALQWVRDNISHFGGDPGNVTIVGGSAGASSVHFLTLSPLSQGLFHKVILQSGCGLNPWSLKEEPKKNLDTYLTLLKYDKERGPKTVVEFLRSIDSHKLVEVQEQMFTPKDLLELNFPFAPTVDDKSLTPFLPVHPLILAEKGIQVPLMVGCNSFEGGFFKNQFESLGKTKIEYNDEKYFSAWISYILNRYDLSKEDFEKIYFKSVQTSGQRFMKLLELFGDCAFVEGLHKLLEIQVRKSGAPTYFYKLSYYKNSRPFEGAIHGDDVNLQFKMTTFEENNIEQLQEGTGDVKIMNTMIELWTNFVKTGRPTPTTSELIPIHWLPVADDVILRYLNIDEELRMEKELSIIHRYSSFKKSL